MSEPKILFELTLDSPKSEEIWSTYKEKVVDDLWEKTADWFESGDHFHFRKVADSTIGDEIVLCKSKGEFTMKCHELGKIG